MRIKQLDLLKYGKFNGERLTFPKADHDFHVIVGPNEAGKSTIRSAVLELLFGMPLRTPLAFLHELTELRLGGHLEDNAGEVVFHRARGRTQIRTPEDGKLPDDFLAPVLGATTREFFEQMFGLDRERLVEGGRSILDASKDLGRVLFQSAAGIGSLGPVREALEARAAELWTRRGGSSEYAQAEARLSEAGLAFKAAQVKTKTWAEARDALEAVGEEIAAAEATRLQLETRRDRLERVRRLTPLLRDLAARENEMAALGPVIDLPSTAYSDLNRGQTTFAGASRVLAERLSDLQARQRDRASVTTDDAVLALAHDIEALEATRGACVNHPRDLPLRQAEVDRLISEAFAAATQLGWPSEEHPLRERIPGALALKTVTSLLREHGALHQALLGAKESAEEKQRDLQALRNQLSGLMHSEVPQALRQALLTAESFQANRARQLSLQAAADEATHHLTTALKALGIWKAPPGEVPVEALRALVLPSPVRVAELQRQAQEQRLALKTAQAQWEEASRLQAQMQLKARHLAEGSRVVTATDVQNARTGRDASWRAIKSGIATVEGGSAAVDAAIRLADELVDAQLGTVTQAAALQNIRQQAELAHADMERKQHALTRHEADSEQLLQAWHNITASAGIPGMALDDMPGWLANRDAAFAAETALRERQRDLAADAAACQEAARKLISGLGLVSVAVPASADLAALAAIAAVFVKKTDSEQMLQASSEQQAAQAERALSTLQAKVTSASNAYNAWGEQWRQALAAARLDGTAMSLAQAEGAVTLANLISEKLEAAGDMRRNRIHAMRADLDSLQAEAFRLAALADNSLLASGDSMDVARRLYTRLRLASSSAQAARLADEALREAAARKKEAEIEVADAEARMRPLLLQCAVTTAEEALPLARHSDIRRSLLEAIRQAESVLNTEGDGLDRPSIEREIAEHDPASVATLQEQAKRDLDVISEQLSHLVQRRVTVEQTFAAINGHATAATAEARRQEALAAMGDAAEQYIELATAGRLLKWAIDRYRDKKQGPMLQRASEVFAQLTTGQFTRLVGDHEIVPPALYARRSTGKLVEVSGLSEGTRDQLFLALRIAALELHLQHATALPFIADDLFVNFDDGRSKAGLQALRELSGRTQVIFLTHHRHLLPLVHEVFGSGVNIVELHRDYAQG